MSWLDQEVNELSKTTLMRSNETETDGHVLQFLTTIASALVSNQNFCFIRVAMLTLENVSVNTTLSAKNANVAHPVTMETRCVEVRKTV